jgi:RNA polymerase sigma-70 factor, ECF subfamily
MPRVPSSQAPAPTTCWRCCFCAATRIAPESQLALALKVVAGFSTPEIARALLTQEDAVAQRIVRAKRQIRERALSLDMPFGSDLPRRLGSVLAALYLWFNEGHLAHEGEELVRADLCHEALRLARLVALHPSTATPQAHALAALLCFHAARLPARQGGEGELLLLRDQDRALWDRALLDDGFAHLLRCADGDEISSVQLEAGIAACHAAAPTYEQTDWRAIVQLYEQLCGISPSPLVELNRAVAVSRLHGPRAGIALLHTVAGDARLARYPMLWAVLGELAFESGQVNEASAYFMRAIESPCSAPQRRFLQSRVERTRGAVAAGSGNVSI